MSVQLDTYVASRFSRDASLLPGALPTKIRCAASKPSLPLHRLSALCLASTGTDWLSPRPIPSLLNAARQDPAHVSVGTVRTTTSGWKVDALVG